MRQRIIKTETKEIFTKTRIPGCDWVINQYIGCGHNCIYCYARFISKWKGYGEWGSWIEAKMNAPELVKGRYIKGRIFMSSVSDAYQPIEKDLNLTRKILENMDKNIELSILTKSDLVLRDMDMLKQFNSVEVGFTVNSFIGKEKELFEPDSPKNKQRVEAMKILKKNGIKTYTFISPIIPGLISSLSSRAQRSEIEGSLKKPTYQEEGALRSSFQEVDPPRSRLSETGRNDREDLLDVIDRTKDYADYYWLEIINMRGAGKEFGQILEKEYSESYEILKNKALLDKYISNLKDTIHRLDLCVRGIERH